MKLKNLFLSAGLVAVGVAGFSTASHAQANKEALAQSKSNVGAMLGVGFLNKDLGTQIDLGLQGNYEVQPNLSVGLYGTYNSISAIAGISSSLFTITPQATYSFDTLPMPGILGVGGKAGIAFQHIGSGTATVAGVPVTVAESKTDSSFVFGPHLVYDLPIQSKLSVGAEANYLIYTAGDGFNAFNLLGAIKYWF